MKPKPRRPPCTLGQQLDVPAVRRLRRIIPKLLSRARSNGALRRSDRRRGETRACGSGAVRAAVMLGRDLQILPANVAVDVLVLDADIRK